MNETPDYLNGEEDGFGGRVQDLLPVAYAESAQAPVSSSHLAFSAPNTWTPRAPAPPPNAAPTPVRANGPLAETIQQGWEWTQEHGGEILDAATEVFYPSNSTPTATSTDSTGSSGSGSGSGSTARRWSGTEIALVTGGVAVAAFTLYWLFRSEDT